ncbi:MAG: ABC transporter permease [Pseudomonadota bacterium]
MNASATRMQQAARLRGAALAQLWTVRGHWRLPVPRAVMRRERDGLIAELMPAVLVIGVMVGTLLFAVLPNSLGSAYFSALGSLWPVWVVYGAPIAAAQMLAMHRAPTLALELTQRQARGEFAVLARAQSSPAGLPCISFLVAHAIAVAAVGFLMIGLTLAAGLVAALVLGAQDIRFMVDAVFSLVSPLDWLRSLVTSLVLGLACSLAAMLYAWPGSRVSAAGVDAHRLGLRAMMISSLAVILCTFVLNWLTGVLGFLKWW